MRATRQARLLALLKSDRPRTAAELASTLGVSERTIYRDTEALTRAGVALTGTPGSGYRLAPQHRLAPLTLTPDEMEALHLALAVLGESDGSLRAAADSLAEKLSAAMEETAGSGAQFAAALGGTGHLQAGLAHLRGLRSALRARQKLRITLTDDAVHIARPLRVSYAARAWTVLLWSETTQAFLLFPLPRLTALTPLPELFVDEPGKRAADFTGD